MEYRRASLTEGILGDSQVILARLEYDESMTSHEDTFFTYVTPHGPLTICASNKGICEIAFNAADLSGKRTATAMTNLAATEIQEYLAGKRRDFDLPLDLRGSAFQKAVWTELCSIGYGQTRTAAEIAAAIGKPGSHRSVGTAIRACRLVPLVPAHRVTAPNTPGATAKIRRALIALEQHALQAQ